ncbi:MAG TPA: neutral/alkaline non-lysosomal ceramidase N-terminal domain-containing protein, partial [Pirellula sp.]|nr:neutral/alkaline non-lysosomal ceramidase N-terminal domain-containing protein [Pirellula sp.]
MDNCKLNGLPLKILLIFAAQLSWTAQTSAQSLQPEKLIFRAGAVAADITPTTPTSIIAGGFLEGKSTQIHDRLFARAIVLDNSVTRLALVIVDTCMMTQTLIDEAKELAFKQSGIAMNHIMVSATHTHSAPAAMA